MKITDAHLHLSESKIPSFKDLLVSYIGASCTLSRQEFDKQEKMISSILSPSIHFLRCFGIHPQNPDLMNRDFLVELLDNNRIDAIGECGFDFFTDEFKSTRSLQEEAWRIQLELAIQYGKPLVVHGRKCSEMFFRDSCILKKASSVIFHSWAGTFVEAQSLLKRGVNGFFSFGKPLLNGRKASIDCVSKLPIERILLETDAPYQTLKGEQVTAPEDIQKIYKEAARIRDMGVDELSDRIYGNFRKAYLIS